MNGTAFSGIKKHRRIYLAYMTGILPIKKYGTHSALNMFDEFSMIHPDRWQSMLDLRKKKLNHLCEKYKMDGEEVKCWYDGYSFDKVGCLQSKIGCQLYEIW